MERMIAADTSGKMVLVGDGDGQCYTTTCLVVVVLGQVEFLPSNKIFFIYYWFPVVITQSFFWF